MTVYDSLSLADKQALLAALEVLDGDEEGAQGGPAPAQTRKAIRADLRQRIIDEPAQRLFYSLYPDEDGGDTQS